MLKMTKRKFWKFWKFANFGKKTTNFQKIITFFATVENSIYSLYIPLRQVTFMRKNKIFRHSVHSRDIEKIRFYLVKFCNILRMQWVTQNFILSHESDFPLGDIYTATYFVYSTCSFAKFYYIRIWSEIKNATDFTPKA